MTETASLDPVVPAAWGGEVTVPPDPESDLAIGWRRPRREALRTVALSTHLERFVAFSVPLAIYLVIGSLLAFKYHTWFGDAQARLANAYYVLYSRDPHLAAIGFVWNPGTSLAELPVLLLKPIWPALSTETFGAVIVSALAMAGAGYQILRFFEELGIVRVLRWALLAVFVASPMILYFGANGMSEALFIFCLVATARYLAQWLSDPAPRPLVASAFYLGLAYIVRNEAIAAALLGSLVVMLVTYSRAVGNRRARRAAAFTDVVLFVSPFALAFIGWALVSWIIVGHPFEQLSSAYGTTSQLHLLGGLGGTPISRFWWVLRALLWVAPTLPLLLPLAFWTSWRQGNRTTFAVAAILGGVVAFELAAYSLGQISWALRYLIYAIPLTVMLAGCYARPDSLDRDPRLPQFPRWALVAEQRTYLVRNLVSGVLAVALAASCIFTTEHAMLYTGYDLPDQQSLAYVLWPDSAAGKSSPARANWQSVGIEAARLDALHLGHGAIMVDNFEPCIPNLILQSKHPKQFSIPNDEDFVERLGAPYQAGVRYFLVPPPTGYGSVDALNKEWPTLYYDGAGVATLAGTVRMADCPTFRLYKLTPSNA